MKLITEDNFNDVKALTEETYNGKRYFVEGVFLQGGIQNRNGRVYPINVLDAQVKNYTDKYILQNRAFGELGHPDGPQINLERVSHMIVGLHKDGNNYIGKAKIMDTPYGKIVKNFIDEGAKLGVSSRGMGSLRNVGGVDEVQEDFYLASAADIVADPSAPDAFVRGIMEGKEWVWDNGVIKEAKIEQYKRDIKSVTKEHLEEAKMKAFTDFLFNM
jgi:hypothetical protein